MPWHEFALKAEKEGFGSYHELEHLLLEPCVFKIITREDLKV